MADDDQEAWWRMTRGLAVATLGGAALAGFLLFTLSAVTGGIVVLGLPLEYLLPAAIMPVVIVALVFWSARRQAEVDRRYRMEED